MDVTTEAADGGSEQRPVVEISAEGEGKLSLSDAARTLVQGCRRGSQDRNSRPKASSAPTQRKLVRGAVPALQR
jgi:hypothetical protein